MILDRLTDAALGAVKAAWPGAPRSAAYGRLLVEEIKPFIDRTFPTLPGRQSTHIAGASMGAVIAAELLSRYPDVFAGAALLSAHFSLLPVTETEVLPHAFSKDVSQAVGEFASNQMPQAGKHRLWLDRSTLSIDRFYGPSHDALVAALLARGYCEGGDLSVQVYPGVGHDEDAWRQRLDDALGFLLALS